MAGGTGPNNIAIGTGANANDTIALPDPTGSVAIGYTASATSSNTIAIGTNAKATGVFSAALGPAAVASGDYSFAGGNGAISSGFGALALGIATQAAGASAIALGSAAHAAAATSVAIGALSSALDTSAIAIGTEASATASSSMALGEQAKAANTNSVALGALSVTGAARIDVSAQQVTLNGVTTIYAGPASTAAGVVSVGTAGAERQIQNVAAGDITSTSTDAVNGSQLYAPEQAFSTLASTVTAGQGSSSAGSQSNTGNATGLDSTATGVRSNASGANATATGQGAQATSNNTTALGQGSVASSSGTTAVGQGASATGANSVALGVGSVANQANTVSVGSAGNERRITNLAPGVNGADAVNMNQLWGLQNSVNQVARNAYSGVAAATALTMIPDVDAGKTIAVGISTASYQGYGASAIGMTARITDNLKVRAGAGVSAAGTTYGAGVLYQW
ncbi:MAG: YadA-like family protein [Paraburkholderia sp.]|uniref:YadA family autotransporter adhesin n=1 Tax=Paraburkholderia sp. TaxID=1926495 RepID=UPI00397BF98C